MCNPGGLSSNGKQRDSFNTTEGKGKEYAETDAACVEKKRACATVLHVICK